MINVISLGAGIQSTALVLLALDGKIEAQFSVFADTGAELPETLDYLHKILMPLSHRSGHNIFEIHSYEYKSLLEYCEKYKIVPSSYQRWCTDKFKLRPLNYFGEDVMWLVGISTDEAKRARDLPNKKYPLLELNMSREDCKDYILQWGLPLPAKSGCFCCPFSSKQQYLRLRANHERLAESATALEFNSRSVKYPTKRKNLPIWGNLVDFYYYYDMQSKMDFSYPEEEAEQEISCTSYQSCFN
jgi:3'-phosphoadenosine 5'-phosphosulfate sulfotransferase (PAPS reductase)/FAD synthetase